MPKSKFKPVLPSLREKKRYLVFEVIANGKASFRDVLDVIKKSSLEFLGQLGVGRAGISIMEDRWDQEKQKGIIRVSNKYIDELKASLMFADKINNKKIIIKSIGVSGILKKAENKFMNNKKNFSEAEIFYGGVL